MKKRGELVTHLVDRLSATADRIMQLYPNPHRTPPKAALEAGLFRLQEEEVLLRKLFNHLVLLNDWRLDGAAMNCVLGVIGRTGGVARIDTELLAKTVVARAADYRPSPAAALAVAHLLSDWLTFWGRGDQLQREEDLQTVPPLQRLIGNAPLAFNPVYPVNALMLRDLGLEAPPAWLSLMEHLATCPASRPGSAWLVRAEELLDALPSGEFSEHAAGWLDAVRLPLVVEGSKRRTCPINVREEAWLSGLAWCVSLRPVRQTLAALGRACVSALKPWAYGQRSRLLASVCVQALTSADHPAAAKVLQQLKAKVRHKAIAAAIAKGVADVDKRTARSKPRSAAKRRVT